ncbi:MAG: EamA family transporter [Cyanobacteria bacterium P01_C01_bin.70]
MKLPPSTGRSSRVSDVLLTAIAPLSWGTTYIVTTEFLPPGHPLLVAALRSLPVGLLLMLGGRRLPQGHWWWRTLILGGLNIGVFQALLFVAAYRLPGGVAATAGAIQPLLVAFFAWAILSKKPRWLAIAAALTGFMGIGILVLAPEAYLDVIGMAAALSGAAAMGLGTVLTKRWQPPVPLMVFTAWQLTVGGLLLLPVALIVEGPFTELSQTNIRALAYLGVIGTGLAYALWFRGIDRLSAAAVSYLGLLSPVVATLLGFVFLQETLSLIQLGGAVIVLVSILVGQQVSQSAEPSS